MIYRYRGKKIKWEESIFILENIYILKVKC